MQYAIGIYARDSLLLSEMIERLNEEQPMCTVRVYGDVAYTQAGGEEYTAESIEGLGREDILIVLGDMREDEKALKEFDGSIIDVTGVAAGYHDDVYDVDEPIVHLFSLLAARQVTFDAAIVSLPVCVFGRNGIEDLLMQTRSIYSFTDEASQVFYDRVAFNILFGAEDDDNILSGYIKTVKNRHNINLTVRMLPISTGFTVDIIDPEGLDAAGELDFAPRTPVRTMTGAIEQADLAIVSQQPGDGTTVTFTGDYLRVINGQIMRALQEITGVTK